MILAYLLQLKLDFHPLLQMTILLTLHSLVTKLCDYCGLNHLYDYNMPNQMVPRWKHDKIYTKSNVSNKIMGFFNKMSNNRWFYGDNDIFLDTSFLNSCAHGLQKLNCYNHVFFKYLQLFELNLKFMTIWKIKVKYLKASEMFLQVFGIFSNTSILKWWTF
jgi:hypothetical protein